MDEKYEFKFYEARWEAEYAQRNLDIQKDRRIMMNGSPSVDLDSLRTTVNFYLE